MKWYYIAFICSLQSLALNGMEPKKKGDRRKVMEIDTAKETGAPVETKPSPPIRRKSKEIVVPRSIDYALEKSLERDAAVTLSAKQLAALAPHFEDRKCSLPKHDRKEHRNSLEIRKTILANRAEQLSEQIVKSQELEILKLERKVRKAMNFEKDLPRKQGFEANLAALDRTAIAQKIRSRLIEVQLDSLLEELEADQANMQMQKDFVLHLAEIKNNLAHQNKEL